MIFDNIFIKKYSLRNIIPEHLRIFAISKLDYLRLYDKTVKVLKIELC